MFKLTAKQAAFVQEYLVDLNATQAAIRAGYSEKTARSIGQENLTKPDILDAIAAAMEKREERTGITQDYVLSSLQEVVERCLQKKPVYNIQGKQVKDEDGNHVWSFNANGANRGLELLGKHLGMFTDKIDVTGNIDLVAAINQARERTQ